MNIISPQELESLLNSHLNNTEIIHCGEILYRYILETNIPVSELAPSFKTDSQGIMDIIKWDKAMTPDQIQKLSELSWVDAYVLSSIQISFELAKVAYPEAYKKSREQ